MEEFWFVVASEELYWSSTIVPSRSLFINEHVSCVFFSETIERLKFLKPKDVATLTFYDHGSQCVQECCIFGQQSRRIEPR